MSRVKARQGLAERGKGKEKPRVARAKRGRANHSEGIGRIDKVMHSKGVV